MSKPRPLSKSKSATKASRSPRSIALHAPDMAAAVALSPALPLPIADICQIAKDSKIASHDWDHRGVAPIGYIKGMAVLYAEFYCRLRANEPTVVSIARIIDPSNHRDALVWYADIFRNAGMGDNQSPQARLRRLFVLMTGLGMRESSGRYCEGRDRHASNTTADTAEAGLFQVSFDLARNRPELLDIFARYEQHPSGHVDIFKERVPCKAADWENFGSPQERGFRFQDLTKKCPAFALELAALGLRLHKGHWGPVARFEAEVLPACEDLFLAIDGAIEAASPSPAATDRVVNTELVRAAAPRGVALARSDRSVGRHYMEPVNLDDLLPINQNLTAAQEGTMVSILGAPQLPLTTENQPERASPLVKRNLTTVRISPNFRLTGLKPAIDDVQAVLEKAFTVFPDLKSVLSTEGMLSVRMRKPTSGLPSKKISNHSWGTAVDFKMVGFEAPGNTGAVVPRFIALLLPLFNAAGWYSGIAFHDSMHFEVSDEKIKKWSREGALH